jgi:hypothetical protein
MTKSITLSKFFPEARQDIEKMFVYIMNMNNPEIVAHCLAKVTNQKADGITAGCMFSIVR